MCRERERERYGFFCMSIGHLFEVAKASSDVVEHGGHAVYLSGVDDGVGESRKNPSPNIDLRLHRHILEPDFDLGELHAQPNLTQKDTDEGYPERSGRLESALEISSSSSK